MAQAVRSSAVAARPPYLEWGAVFAGAIAAAAISFVLFAFGGAVGLSMTSPWPYSGVSAMTIAIVVALWTVLVQVGSYACGGYLAGRLRSRWGESSLVEGQFRDGAHGFMVWAVGVLFSGLVLAVTSGAALTTATLSGATIAAGTASGAGNNDGPGPVDYAVDYLLRPGPTQTTAPAGTTAPALTPPAGTAPQQPSSDVRDEAGRIFSSSIRNSQFTARDRDYLTQIVVTRTGLAQPEAQKRVDEAMNEAKALEIKAREQADKARKAALLTGFLAAATLLISCGAAVAGASLGGRHRDQNRSAVFFGRRFW